MARKLPPNFAVPSNLTVIMNCDHEVELVHDPRAPFGFEAVRCEKCGTKFYIPAGEAY